jgi:hypothetical protein
VGAMVASDLSEPVETDLSVDTLNWKISINIFAKILFNTFRRMNPSRRVRINPTCAIKKVVKRNSCDDRKRTRGAKYR